ncbi:MAG TPA: glycosyltransferase family 4 protein [Candidatus Polarisedimenticolia bacterium]|nr:glycosyltransferase family 4 protein [Candidatus Polarisedimenticolia bacterium]
MKVVLTTDSYLPRLGGQEMGAFRLAKYLTRRGHEVRLVTTEKHPLSGPEPGGFDVLRAPHAFGFSARRDLSALLRHEFSKADVVHARYCYRLAALGAPVAHAVSRRFVVSLHGLGLLDNPNDSLLRRLGHRRYRRISLSSADAVIATSSEFARLAAAYASPARIHVIPNGVDTDEFAAGRPVPEDLQRRYAGDKVVLAIRRLVPKNGIQYLVQAAPEILRACPSARFVIGGWGSQESDLRQAAAALGVAQRFDFVGKVPNAQVADYLAAASVVVFPSSMESTSHACLEAMAMGKPVVASRLGGLAELLGEDGRGILVDLFASDASTYDAPATLEQDAMLRLAGAIAGLLHDTDRAQCLGEAARSYALAHFDWNVLVDRIVQVYRGDATA